MCRFLGFLALLCALCQSSASQCPVPPTAMTESFPMPAPPPGPYCWNLDDVGEDEYVLRLYGTLDVIDTDEFEAMTDLLALLTPVEVIPVTELPTFVFAAADGANGDDVKKIAEGHSFDKHVQGNKNVNGKEFEKDKQIGGLKFPDKSITTKAEFEKFIKDIVDNTTEKKNSGANPGKVYYWDARTGTIVIYDPRNKDKGTAFRPDKGKKYYDDQK